MAKAGKVVVTGVKDVDRALRALPLRVQKKVVRQAMRKNMKPLADRARLLAPVEKGTLEKSIKVRTFKSKKRDVFGIEVDAGGPTPAGNVEWAGAQEYGTKDIAAQPFMRPTFDELARPARDHALEDIRDGVEREAKALAKK